MMKEINDQGELIKTLTVNKIDSNKNEKEKPSLTD